jgi:hypothetical protein
VCLEPARFGLFPFSPRNFCAREFSLNFSATHNGGIETKEKIYEYENNFDYRFGCRSRRGCNVVCTTSFAVHDGGRPQNSLLHLPDAPVGQVGQTRQLPGVRDESATGLCGRNRHERRASGGVRLLLILTKENL